ncbi:MAG: carbohydrate ABC transporter permease [Vallitalea sp.]|jgi:putative aldouronate transport system permease protein|nr:carbohydrate ABC transporter permease [Vallitalea sp.]
MKTNLTEKIVLKLNTILLILIGLTCLYPVIYVFSASISSGDAVATGKVILLPINITFDAYKQVTQDPYIWIGYLNTFFYTLVGTFVSMIVTICGAYPLSKKDLPGRKFFMLFAVITMWVNAGIIPTYLNFKSLGLTNTRTAIIIGFACSTFNMILLKNFFESVPSSLEESAKIDGASDFQVLIKIYWYLSKPALATVGLFYAVSRWNGYFWSMILLSDDKKVPLQVVLKRMIVEMNFASENIDLPTNVNIQTFIYATIMISTIPMFILYPFIQKYFAKGIMVGAIKG